MSDFPWLILRLYGWLLSTIGSGLMLIGIPARNFFQPSPRGGEWGIPDISGIFHYLANFSLGSGIFLLLCGIVIILKNKWLTVAMLVVSVGFLVVSLQFVFPSSSHIQSRFSEIFEFVFCYFLLIILPEGLALYDQLKS